MQYRTQKINFAMKACRKLRESSTDQKYKIHVKLSFVCSTLYVYKSDKTITIFQLLYS